MVDREILTVLQRATENGSMSSEVVVQYIEMQEKQELLKQHTHKIWQGKNGRFFSYVTDDNGNRKLLSKATREQLEESIISHAKKFYKVYDKNTFENVFKEWLNSKLNFGEIQKNSFDRYNAVFLKFVADTEIASKPVRYITEFELENFIKQTIKSFNLSAKGYANLRTIILGTFKFAKRKGLNVIPITAFFQDMQLSRKIFKPNKKAASEQVFTDREVKLIHTHIQENFSSVLDLGVLLVFLTGLRAGELSAIKKCDIENNILHVRRMERREKDDKGKYIYKVVDTTKTEAGARDIVLTDEALKIIRKINFLNPDGEYLLMENGVRYIGKKYTVRLYQICDKLKIPRRSLHKARKTYCTRLINAGVSESIIISQVGHTDIKTTRDYYLFNNQSAEQILKQVDKALAI